ncbi:unnamed protein product [Brassicogethes aeneus]|uniref:WD repeat-containing protein 60 n=1 Tax=Brassicogethes aeneus TaxID=1431903 RepID=A0A9P0BAA3_BRAAE|nr:unnamed protein product [Brassicogethes aeneus]
MSTKKVVSSQSVLKKKVATTSKLSTRKRDDSVERSVISKKEVPKTNVVKVNKEGRKDVKVKKITQDTSARKNLPHKSSKVTQDVKLKDTSVRKSAVNKTSLKMEIPSTPPSNRVTKSQFFPSKSLYSKAIKTTENISTKETLVKPIIVKNSKLKQVKEKPQDSPETSISERPRTATLRKGSIVNANIVGPEAPKHKKHREIKPESPQSDNYEDDFESYDSDFEAYSSSSSASASDLNNVSSGSETSISDNTENQPKEFTSTSKRSNSAGTEDERKLDSGNFDLPEQKHKQLLYNIKESIEKENSTIAVAGNPASLSDEGFEEAKSLQFINFAGAQEKFIRRKSAQLRRKRGQEILSMIRMDTYDFTLFNLEPIPYEKFIQTYGKTNSAQTSTQTGEDNVCEETQTDLIEVVSKWTQFPINFSKHDQTDSHFWNIYKSDLLGVGCDNTLKIDTNPIYDNDKLDSFIHSTGKLILRIQEESIRTIPQIVNNQSDIPFSEGTIHLNTINEIFKDCSVKCAAFATNNSNMFLAVHSKTINKVNDFKSIISLWNISYSQDPKNILISFNDVTACTFEFGNSELIIGGTNDGSLLIWNLESQNDFNTLIGCPNFSTDINSAHNSKVVAIESLTNYWDSTLNFNNNQRQVTHRKLSTLVKTILFQICSLDEDGEIILWNLVKKSKNDALIKNVHISLTKLYPDLVDLKCTDLIMDKRTINNIYVGTNYGNIIKYQFNGSKSNPKELLSELTTEVNCLEPCPFLPNYFLAGYKSGNINLLLNSTKKPLNILSNNEADFTKQSVQELQWSRNRPFVIYSKDETNSIHIWDLAQSDIFPVYSIPFRKEITCMKLSPLSMNNAKSSMEKSYMILGTSDGEIHLHVLSEEHTIETKEKYEEDIKTFVNYVNRL